MLMALWPVRRFPSPVVALLTAVLLSTLLPGTLEAQDRRAALAGFTYDPAIPTLTQVVGHDHGAEVTSPEEIAIYMRALANAAPDRTRLEEIGRSWEGRPLQLLAIASPDRIARLDGVRRDLLRLADPRTLSRADEDALVSGSPIVVALLHSVHGNEISPAGAALLEAYHLLAARNDPRVDAILKDAVVLILPLQNPDGRARMVQSTRSARAAEADALPLAAEHDEPWPGGRGNHYLFDLNRDWFAQTQPESSGKVAALLRWMPHVVVDLHEMGGDSTYYFPPNAVPGNPHTTPAQREALTTVGRAIAGAFDARGYPYFTGEVFDAFYPGYGVSWPIAQGSVGMTFEKASARGLTWRRDDGTVLTYLDGIIEHFTAALTTAQTAAERREAWLRAFVSFRRSAVTEGESHPTTRQYVLIGGDHPERARRLATLLRGNGIDVQQTTAPTTVDGRMLPAGTIVVPHGQPAGRLVRNLLDERTDMPADFVREQMTRREKRLPDQIYDVTAWSLPLLFDVETLRVPRPLGEALEPWRAESAMSVPAARVGYLMPWSASAARLTAAALREGLKVRVTTAPTTVGGRTFGVGTALVRTTDAHVLRAGRDVRTALGELTQRVGVELVPIDSAFVESGISLGSNGVVALQSPRVLLAWDAPAASLSAGWARYILERQVGIVPSAVRVSTLPRLDLAEFDVIVLPSGNYATALAADLVRRLKDWVSAGGTLVTIGDATRWATGASVGLLATTAEWKGGAPIGDETTPAARPSGSGGATQPIDLAKAIEPVRELPPLVPGAIANTVVDTEHWLSSGLGASLAVSLQGQRIFSPIRLDQGRNVVTFSPRERLVASGIIWEESQGQLPGKPYLMHQPTGRGHVVAFADDPNARAFADATQLLFINAVLLGPAQ